MSNKTSIWSLVLLLILPVYLSASPSLKIKRAWIPEAPPSARIMAGFMGIYNASSQNIDIISISSPAFKRIEMHRSIQLNGMAKMQPQKTLSIPAKGELILKSGSYHLMLIKPARRLMAGDKAALNFILSNGEKISLNVSIKKTQPANTSTMKCGAGKCATGK